MESKENGIRICTMNGEFDIEVPYQSQYEIISSDPDVEVSIMVV